MEIDEIKDLTNGTDILNDIYDLISDLEVEIGEGSVGISDKIVFITV